MLLGVILYFFTRISYVLRIIGRLTLKMDSVMLVIPIFVMVFSILTSVEIVLYRISVVVSH